MGPHCSLSHSAESKGCPAQPKNERARTRKKKEREKRGSVSEKRRRERDGESRGQRGDGGGRDVAVHFLFLLTAPLSLALAYLVSSSSLPQCTSQAQPRSRPHRSQHSRHHIHTHTHTHTLNRGRRLPPTRKQTWTIRNRFPVLQHPHRLAQQLLHTHCSLPSRFYVARPSAITAAMSSSSARMQCDFTSKPVLDSTPSTVTL